MEPQRTPDKKKRSISTLAFKAATCVFVLVILVSLFRWTLVEYLTPLLERYLEMAVGIIFFVSVVWSVVHMIWARKQGAMTALLPLLLNVATILVVMFVPFSLLTIQLDFRVHYQARMEAVSSILNGKYEGQAKGGRGDLIALPGRLSYLSTGGGEIMLWRRQDATLIFFFDFRGILDSFSGFIYSTNDSPPQQGDFGTQFVEVEHLRQNWFWATSRN